MDFSLPAARLSADQWVQRLRDVRAASESLAQGLEAEDFVVQAVPEASPLKWHLAHTTWFWETFALQPYVSGYNGVNAAYATLFNSYYNAVGPQWSRAQRGLLTRPTVAQTFDYRHRVDEALANLVCGASDETLETLAPVLEIGIQHEQQHQELSVTDLKALFALNPLEPVYRERLPEQNAPASPASWRAFEAGLYDIGADGSEWGFDNEGPRHRVWLPAFALASHLVTCGEWLEFMQDGGYSRSELWLSLGWNWVERETRTAPRYWRQTGNGWRQMTLGGFRAVEASEPVAHVSYFEADAFARWRGARLPSEAEWEIVARGEPIAGNFLENGAFHPVAPTSTFEPFGNLWTWTRSSYAPYSGYNAAPGALGEYNGKFMCNQYVLRGGSCATPRSHIRATYRNFFPPDMDWQFCGVRLARDV